MRRRAQVVDELLVLAAQAGQVEAFEQLARRWHPRLLRHARGLAGDPEGAQEVVQESWVAIVRGLRKLRDPARFGPWALSITSRRCADWIVRRQSTRERTAPLDEAAKAATRAAGTDDLERVREALGRLDPARRALLALYYVAGLTVSEVARALDIPAGTAKSRLYHARERLRAALEVQGENEERR